MIEDKPSPVDSAADEEERVSLGVLPGLVGYHMRRASGVIGEDFARALEGTGVRQVLFGILSIVEANPGINQGTAGRMLGIQRANMVGPVNELVEHGWLDRQVDANDRRAFSLSLTKAGKEAFADALARIRAHEDRLMSDFSAAERSQLVELLSRLEAREA